MTLSTIFLHEVDRPIEGVIKADDEASLRQEIEEYVLTNEVSSRLEDFLDAYNNYQGANGVWVSGFFGSGKSHLLKMLALILEDRKIESESTLSMFLPKCGDNEILRAQLKRAASIPSHSILFNIDQKADVISKSQLDALLAVFIKVFDEMCGYYGKQPYIAQFERDLDRDDLLDPFKQHFSRAAGKDWEWGRSRPSRVASHIDQAFNQVTGQSQSGVLDKYRSDYRLSIEDFAEQVNDYIQQQKPGFRLNFFVDEVGQYIADNTKLMTNLQTVAESLATKCEGQAWVLVTAQEDMDTVVGEMDKQKGNDFTKIQARFSNRMKLTSTDVAEVIQKRLLMKTDQGIQQLAELYHTHSGNFKTLFDFSDGSSSYRSFRDRDHFIHCYPFVPYQFELFQSAIQNLSLHNAFEGKHSSVGERSMLGVFQQVAVQIRDHKLGDLATFDLMFEGIRTALKSSIQKAILQAERQLDNRFAIQVLKALFLVKYVKEFKPSLRNLCVLMLGGFDQKLPELRKKMEEALELLEQQTYIQRNGDLYDYLTDEEKDIEEEIKNTEVDSVDVANELEKIIFDHVLRHRKIRYNSESGSQGQDYHYSKKLDDQLYGREYELSINVITPFHDHISNDHLLSSNSTYNMATLFIVMPEDDRLPRDLLMYKRTEKYVMQNISVTKQDVVKRILTEKGFQNRERFADLQQRVRSLLGQARVLLAGTELDIGSSDGQSRIMSGFQALINRSYPNLRMLRGIQYTENDIANYLSTTNNSLLSNDATTLTEAEQEMLAYIQSNNRSGVRTTAKSLLEKFEKSPYGWYYPAILCILASLCARGKVEVRDNSNPLNTDELERALRNSNSHGNLVLEPQAEFSASKLRALKEFYGEFFDTPPTASEARALGQETAKQMKILANQLQGYLSQATRYPFLNQLKPLQDKIGELAVKPYDWFLEELPRQEDELLDDKENLLDPLRRFMGGAQKEIYDQAQDFLGEQQSNFGYLDGNEADDLASALANPQCFKGQHMQQVKVLHTTLQDQVSARLTAEQSKAAATLQELQQRLCGTEEFQLLQAEQQQKLLQPFAQLEQQLQHQRLIAVVRDKLRNFEEQQYKQLLATLSQLAQPVPNPTLPPGGAGSVEDNKQPPHAKLKEKPSIEYVSSKDVAISFGKAWLADEQDVEQYLESMREALLEEIRQGKRIQI